MPPLEDAIKLQRLINSGAAFAQNVVLPVSLDVLAALADGLVMLPPRRLKVRNQWGILIITREDRSTGAGGFEYVRKRWGQEYADAIDEVGEDILK